MLLPRVSTFYWCHLLLVALTGASVSADEAVEVEDNGFTVQLFEQHSKPRLPDPVSELNDHDALLVSTEHGRLRGRLNLTPMQRLGWPLNPNKDPTRYPRLFAGIPFAEPPTGKRRFLPPVTLEKAWEGVDKQGKRFGSIRDATRYAPDCPQLLISLNQAEDCLYLNVFVPPAARHDPSRPFPVLMWIFGGAFYFGGAYEFGMYDGQFLTEHKDVIVVTANHRTNAFGFFASDEVRGNAGIEDQREAMLWIKRNIHAFGGDPNNITVMGMSSGAASVGIHMASPRTPPGLFHRAIMQSNPFGVNMRSKEDIKATSAELAQVLGCLDKNGKANLACVQSKSQQDVLHAMEKAPNGPLSNSNRLSNQFDWWPSIDGYNIVEQPLTSFELGHFNRDITVIMGSVQDEGALWIHSMTFPLLNVFKMKSPFGSRNDFRKKMESIFGSSVDTMDSLYPTHDDAEQNKETLTRSLLITCLFVANSIAHYGGKVFTYHYTSKVNAMSFGYCHNRVCHASDLLLTWRMPFSLPMKPAMRQISDNWISYITNFAATGNPNIEPSNHSKGSDEKLYTWRAHSDPQGPYLQLERP
ncbi:Carboxylesterase family-domain-containing protein [Syncephalis plumigaleata]|nr:Carboxylesterase family-domain-containing protein [Syncephalis plumigaleata]